MLRSSSCSSAGLASDTKPEVHLTPLREVIVRDAPRPLAPTGRPPLGSFPPCSPSTSKRTCDGLRSSFRLPTSHLAPPPALPESTWDRPFSGLHYAALTAPGPTGTRPEHITDLFNVPRRVALSALFCKISAGALPPAARWLTRTRLCWQRKKNGKPRPIKMGEFLRSAYAKRLVNLSQVHLRTKTLHMHQWGVNLPGACEALCHWRGTIEPLVLNGTLEPLVAADLDLVNMFGNAEWPHIRAALCTHFPEASAWTEWQHQSTDRGAEQGDVLGTIQSALVLGVACETHLQDFLSSPFEQKGVCDEWFDDGQCFVWPMLFDRWLRALDSALASFGATRGRIALGNAKSSARLLCPPERIHEFSGWDTAYVRDTVVVLNPDAGTTALGSAFGTTELVLTRQYADVSKLMYHMRINGDILDHDLFASFDGQLRASVSNSLCGDLPDHSWWQATTGVTVGGLGLRTAVTVALPAFVASRILSRLSSNDHGGVRRTHGRSLIPSCLHTPCGTSLPLPLVTPGASRLTTAMVTKNTRTRASAPRFRASSPRTLTLAFVRACCKCLRVRDPGPHARASLSLATLMWITRGCGGSTLAMARPWMLMSTLIRSCARGTHHLRRLQLWHSGHGRGACLLLRPGRGHAWSKRRLLSHTRSRTTMRPHLRDGGTWPHPWHGLEGR